MQDRIGDTNAGNESENKHWNAIRKLTTPAENVDFDSTKTIKHGFYKATQLITTNSIKSVTHNIFSGQYVVLYENGSTEIFLKDGSKDGVQYSPKGNINCIIFASKPKLFLTYQRDKIKIMKSNFKKINSVPSLGNLSCMLYNEFTNEVLSASPGSIMVWNFRMNNTLIVPKISINEKLGQGDDITTLILEQTSSKLQRLFVAVRNNVLVYRLADGKLIAHMAELHRRDITDLLFYQPFKVLITCAIDGSIKVWDESWNLKSVFIGHTSVVNSLSAYQKSPLFVSGSDDGTMRLWNIDTSEEIDCINTGHAVKGMCKKFGEDSFYSFTDDSLTFWKINTVYSIFTVIGSKAKVLKSTSHPRMPMLTYSICEDACIRITCPKDGNVVTVMMSPMWIRILDAVFAITEEILFVLLRDGSIVKCSTATNPCTIQETWPMEKISTSSSCEVLCLFENAIEDDLVGDRWQDLIIEQKYQHAYENTKESDENNLKNDRIILFGGFKDGSLAAIKWRGAKNRGQTTFNIEAHRGAVVALACSSVLNQLASCSTDKTVRIWRVFPFAEDSLAPLMYIMNSEPATHLVFSRHRLCVAFQDVSTATYNITMYKTTESEPVRVEHGIDDDHIDKIVSICSCPKHNLFASSSVDGVIKLWSENNRLIRVIQLNSRPNSLCFSTQRGDLLVGIGEHIHRIPYNKYLPDELKRRMVLMQFIDPPGLPMIQVDNSTLKHLDDDQKHRLQKARSSAFIVAKFVDTIPEDELEERMEEENRKEMGLSILKKRDDDLIKIRDGELEAKKKPIPSQSVREEAWQKYLNIFYRNPVLPPIPNKADMDQEPDYTPTEERDHYTPERGNTGFFSISAKQALNIDKLKQEIKDELNSKARKKRSDSILSETAYSLWKKETERPLSVGLHPELHVVADKCPMRRVLSAPGRPGKRLARTKSSSDSTDGSSSDEMEPGDSSDERKVIDVSAAEDFPSSKQALRNLNRQITDELDSKDNLPPSSRKKERSTLPIAPDGYLPNSIVVALYKELKREETVEEERWKPVELTQQQMDELEAFNRRKRRKPTHVEIEKPAHEEPKPVEKVKSKVLQQLQDTSMSPTVSVETEIDISTPPPTPPRSPTPEAAPESDNKEKPRVIKPVKPIEKLITRPIVKRTPTPPREPTPPPRPKTPLPSFILQFKGQKWFEKCFPNALPELFPKPWSMVSFLLLMLEFLRKEQDHEIKIQICAAIMMLLRQTTFDDETLLRIQSSILAQLNLPFECKPEDADNHKLYTKTCLTLLNSLGLINSQLIVELMTQFITSDVEIRLHALQTLQDIGLHDHRNYFKRELDTFSTYGIFDKTQIKSAIKEQCKAWLRHWMEQFRQHISSLAGKIYRAKKGNVVRGTKDPKTDVKSILRKGDGQKDKQADSKKISFMPNDFVSDAAKNATEIDAINYFCEMEFQQELERARNAIVAPSEEAVKSERLRNTVLILPKIDGYKSLARLGETHKSCCHPERETSLAYDLRLPPISQSKQDNLARGLIMHLNTLTLNPFPNLLDELLYEPFANNYLFRLNYPVDDDEQY
eukprot:gene18922-20826_t